MFNQQQLQANLKLLDAKAELIPTIKAFLSARLELESMIELHSTELEVETGTFWDFVYTMGGFTPNEFLPILVDYDDAEEQEEEEEELSEEESSADEEAKLLDQDATSNVTSISSKQAKIETIEVATYAICAEAVCSGGIEVGDAALAITMPGKKKPTHFFCTDECLKLWQQKQA